MSVFHPCMVVIIYRILVIACTNFARFAILGLFQAYVAPTAVVVPSVCSVQEAPCETLTYRQTSTHYHIHVRLVNWKALICRLVFSLQVHPYPDGIIFGHIQRRVKEGILVCCCFQLDICFGIAIVIIVNIFRIVFIHMFAATAPPCQVTLVKHNMILVLQLESQIRNFVNVLQFDQLPIVSRLPHVELRQLLLVDLNENAAASVAPTKPHAHGRKALEMVLGTIDAGGPGSLEVVNDCRRGGNPGQSGGCY
mmetsp:Transcript_18648/g.30957  ORF Transcript_18648/g.30957 Transcript_18648/m.30957 type:complete len:252 (+) Transcript_18648:222-977(+)